ncbi:T9SS type A sorting domain-containing protein [Lacinutrix algicola]|uniref:T9SS type A sorting domain-containing protein n=1 Tax=Lacinutrix algicola TaxID=342954 RepID=UPI0006E24023|nr:T9SS type A sorting domain-containing protein [Lacinutrix algicola]
MKKITLFLGLMLMAFSYQANAQITVGSGTGTQSNVPIVSCFGYTYSQQLYPQAEINSVGNITSVAFYVSSVPATNDESTDWTISMGHSTKTEFADTADWEEASSLTEVYTGTVTYPEAGNWMTITFDTPFAYNNTDNLIVAIDENQTGWDCTINWQKTDTAENRSIYYRSDSTNPDPASPPTATGVGAYYANTVFGGLTASLPPNCDAALTTPVDGEMNADLNAGLAWSAATGSPDGYKVTLGTSTGANDIANAVDVGADLTYAVTLIAGTTYFATIVPYNANGDSTGCTEVSFTTVDIPECPVVTGTPDAACGNFDSNLSWTAITGADSYTVSVGTSAGATDIADSVDVGSVLTYDFVSTIATTYYYTVNAVNSAGTSSGCTEGSFTSFSTGCYCDSIPSSNDNDGIGNLQVGTTDFVSGGDITYEDFTGTPIDLGQGVNANVVITFMTNYTYGTNIWIDFNDNFTFDDSELLYTGESPDSNTGTDILDASFLMPTTATLGNHRMRIVTDDTNSNATNPCNSSTYGVTMDVDVNIIAVSCTAPVATATLVTDCANAQFSVDVDVTDLGSGTPAIFDGTTTTPITAVGLITVGPFADGTAVSLVIEHGSDTVCDLSLGSFTNTCPPSNNDCSSSLPIVASEDGTCNESVSGTTNNASISSDSCSTSGRDVWYSFTSTVDGDYIIGATETFDSSFSSTYVTAYEGDCGSLTQIGNSTSCFNTADLIISTVAGNVYSINVRSSSSTGYVDFDLCVYPAPLPPANDTCVDALPILDSTDGTCNESVSGTTSGAAISSDSCSTSGRDVWYSFTSPTDGDYVVGVTETFESSSFISTYVTAYEGDCGSLTQIGNSTSCFNTANLIISTVAGNVYSINVRSSSSTGYVDFDLCVFPAPLPPANDACVDATFIAGFNNGDMQDAFGATNNDGFITGCGSANDGVWYTFEVAIAGTINVDVTAVVGWDPEITVLSGGCGTFTCVDNADGGGSDGDESVSFVAEADTQYWVNVGHYSGTTDNAEGPFAIDISSPDTAVLATSLDVEDFNRVSLFSYYPNPVNNTLTLNAQQAINNVSIFNMLGQEVIKSAPNAVSKAIDMSNLQSGAYFVKVTVGTTVETVRVIKN